MYRAIIIILGALLLNTIGIAKENFNWVGTYIYTTGGSTVTGGNYVYGQEISVKRTKEGELVARVEEYGRMTSSDIIICDVKISKNNKTMTLYFNSIVDEYSDRSRKKTGLFMSLTRKVKNNKELFYNNDSRTYIKARYP